jgi:hypothetical protein
MKRSDIPTTAILHGCHRFHALNALTCLEFIMLKYKAPEKVALAAMERELDRGLIEYGVSLATAWVTSKGYEYLKES